MQRGDRITGIATASRATIAVTRAFTGRLDHHRARPVWKNELRPQRRGQRREPKGGAGKDQTALGARRGRVVVFSLEMPREQLANRDGCSEGKVDVSKVRSGFLGSKIGIASRKPRFSAASRLDDDSMSLSILELRAKVRSKPNTDREGTRGRGARKMRPGHVDYLQLMKGARRIRAAGDQRDFPDSKGSPKAKVRSSRCRNSIVLSNAKRKIEAPQISDLREWAPSSRDATIFALSTGRLYKKSSTNPTWRNFIAKQRNGPTGTAKVRFDASTPASTTGDGEYEDDEAEKVHLRATPGVEPSHLW